jgi:hypothetical protein
LSFLRRRKSKKINELDSRARGNDDLFIVSTMMKSIFCYVLIAMLSMPLMAFGSTPNIKTSRIILKGADLSYNGKPLKLGASLEDWVKVIGEPTQNSSIYKWESLGLVAKVIEKDVRLVERFKININLEAYKKLSLAAIIRHEMEEKPPASESDSRADHKSSPILMPILMSDNLPSFSGYLELNGLSISSATMLDEIKKFFAGDHGSLKEGVWIKFVCHKSVSDCSYRSGDIVALVSVDFVKLDRRRDYGIGFIFLIDRKNQNP